MPLLDLSWTMLLLFLFIAWISLLIQVYADVFRSDDLSGLAKAAWTLFVLVLPYLGVFVYLIDHADTTCPTRCAGSRW